jgi:hypothetical protein
MTTVKNPHAVALGRLGGAVKSDKKTASSRRNGLAGGKPFNLRGGRPKKAAGASRAQEER